MALVQIRRVGVLQAARLYAAFAGILGLMGGVMYGLLLIFIGVVNQHNNNMPPAAMIGIGIGSMIMAPIVYAITGFIFGALGALVYNVLAGFLGGIEIEIEDVNHS